MIQVKIYGQKSEGTMSHGNVRRWWRHASKLSEHIGHRSNRVGVGQHESRAKSVANAMMHVVQITVVALVTVIVVVTVLTIESTVTALWQHQRGAIVVS
jgi:hypothetical protein